MVAGVGVSATFLAGEVVRGGSQVVRGGEGIDARPGLSGRDRGGGAGGWGVLGEDDEQEFVFDFVENKKVSRQAALDD